MHSDTSGWRGERLTSADLEGPVTTVAPGLLGCVLEHGGVAVRLTEVEAYDGGNDPGSHAYRGRTPRTSVMFGEAGHLYVYFSYGMHWCANVVTGTTGAASAVLLRAGEVVGGEEFARARREATRSTPVATRDLARGPASLARCLGLTGDDSGRALCGDPEEGPVLWRPGGGAPGQEVRSGPRVGVSGPGGDGDRYPWRFWLAGEPSVSAYRAAVPRTRARG